MKDPWTPVDPLGDALHFLRLRGLFYSRCELSAPWPLALSAMRSCLMVDVVTSGRCRLEVAGAEPCGVSPGAARGNRDAVNGARGALAAS